jgi:anti-sigma factor RsiW
VISPVGHLGNRVSALLDGQLSAEETERAWAHVHGCHACRDLVEREGWIKTRLQGVSLDSGPASDRLKGCLLGALPAPLDPHAMAAQRDHRRRQLGMVALGVGAVGAAVMGVVALGFATADGPVVERRAPASISQTPGPRTPVPVDPIGLRSGTGVLRHVR